jgi:hypothetical protein
LNANRHDPARELAEPPENIERAVERAAQAMWDVEGGDQIPWQQLSRPGKAMWRRRANAALQSQWEEDLTDPRSTTAEEIGFRLSWGIRK